MVSNGRGGPGDILAHQVSAKKPHFSAAQHGSHTCRVDPGSFGNALKMAKLEIRQKEKPVRAAKRKKLSANAVNWGLAGTRTRGHSHMVLEGVP